MTKRKSKSEVATDNLNESQSESTRDLPEPLPALETSTRDPEPTESAPEISAGDSSLEFGNLTRVARILGGASARSEYERARVNVPIIPVQRQQLDVLTNEWDCTLTEAVRRVLTLGLSQIMQTDQSE